MACAYAKYTSKLGACVATSGPGAIHLLTGLYDAKADNTSVIAIIGQAMAEKRPTIVEAVVDPFEPPMPPKVDMEFVANLAESFAKGQTYARRIGLTLFRNQVHDALRSVHSHDTADAQ
jgi:thiamine pyrophosphate-dependent acetolactate synthase large subunit-like protein